MKQDVKWKFWKKRRHKLGVQSGAGPPVISTREILGLQQLIGNQAVLRMMKPRVAADQGSFGPSR